MWFVYIILCNDHTLYTGISINPTKRFWTHQNGKGGRYTKSHKPLKIVYTEKHVTKSTALKRELQIKGWKKKTKIEKLKLEI